MKGDEFDGQGAGPLPPHDRQWRHPAEIADARRTEFLRHSTPPPLSRRTTTIVAAASVAASVALVAVAVPEGIEEWRDDAPAVASVASAKAPTVGKGTLGGRERHVVVSASGESGAVHLGEGFFLTSLDAVDSADDVTVGVAGGALATATVAATDSATGIVILSMNGEPPAGGTLADLPAAVAAEPGMVVVDPADGSSIPCDGSITLTAELGDDLDVVPVAPSRGFKGATLAYDQLGTVLGLVVNRASSSLLVSRGTVEELLARARRDP